MTTSDLLTLFRIGVDAALLIAAGVAVYWLRRLARKIREERELVRGLLTTIKGWTVVNVSKEVQKELELKATRQSIEAIPDKTADKVVDRLSSSESLPDSAQLPVVKLPRTSQGG